MTNSEQAIREILEKYDEMPYSDISGCLSDLTALISEHYVAKEDVNQEVERRIADKMVEEKWINVKDGLPEKDGKSSIYCLVNSKYDGIVVRPYNEYHKCWDAEDADDYYCDAIDGKITHWMPLPNPPIK